MGSKDDITRSNTHTGIVVLPIPFSPAKFRESTAHNNTYKLDCSEISSMVLSIHFLLSLSVSGPDHLRSIDKYIKLDKVIRTSLSIYHTCTRSSSRSFLGPLSFTSIQSNLYFKIAASTELNILIVFPPLLWRFDISLQITKLFEREKHSFSLLPQWIRNEKSESRMNSVSIIKL